MKKPLRVLSVEKFVGKFAVPNNPTLARVETERAIGSREREFGEEVYDGVIQLEYNELRRFYRGLYQL